MKRPDPPSDRDIAEAFQALDGTIPDGHLDDFSSRVLARLDEPEVGVMDSSELARGSGLRRPDEAALGAAAAEPPRTERDEHSGLHEIKALASTTRKRISQKITSETEAEESLLVGASSGSFRAAAVLPDPSHQKAAADAVSDRAVERARERLSDARPVARPASEVDSRPLPSRASSAPFWIFGGVATCAAAAAVAVFVFGIGREKDEETSAADSTVARAETPAQASAATGAPASEPAPDMRFAQPPPPADTGAPAGAAAPAASTPMVAAIDGEERAADEGGGGKGRAGGASGDTKSDQATAKSEPEKKKQDSGDKEKDGKKPPVIKDSGGKDLGDVLDQVTGGVEAPAKVEEEGPKKPSKKELDRRDVSKAMSAVRSSVMKCRDKEQYEGTVTVKFHVAPSGQVTGAEATGSKKGTPTGDCVAAAVKRAKFPAFDGATTSFTFPFLLAE